MAEAMANKYGSDCLIAESAGTSPGLQSHATVRAVLLQKNVDLGKHIPKRYHDMKLSEYDVIVNMSGSKLPELPGLTVETWTVADPFGKSEERFKECRDALEMLVMRLVLRIRTGKFDVKKG